MSIARLNERICEVKKELKQAIEIGNEDLQIDLGMELHELEDDLRFAWADNEAEMDGRL